MVHSSHKKRFGTDPPQLQPTKKKRRPLPAAKPQKLDAVVRCPHRPVIGRDALCNDLSNRYARSEFIMQDSDKFELHEVFPAQSITRLCTIAVQQFGFMHCNGVSRAGAAAALAAASGVAMAY
jgi:hypothetical protein